MKKTILFSAVTLFVALTQAQVRVGSGGNGGGFAVQYNAASSNTVIQFPGITDQNDVMVISSDRELRRWVTLTRIGNRDEGPDQYSGKANTPIVNVVPGTYIVAVAQGGSTVVVKKAGQALVVKLREVAVADVPAQTAAVISVDWRPVALVSKKTPPSMKILCATDSFYHCLSFLYAADPGPHSTSAVTTTDRSGKLRFEVLPGTYSLGFQDPQGRRTELHDVKVD